MSRPSVVPMQAPVHDVATCPRCHGALEFDTDRAGHVIDWCPRCINEARRRELVLRYTLPARAQRHQAAGLCTHADGYVLCTERQAGTAGYSCHRYCPKHCQLHEHGHACQRGRVREYMRQYKHRSKTAEPSAEVAA